MQRCYVRRDWHSHHIYAFTSAECLNHVRPNAGLLADTMERQLRRPQFEQWAVPRRLCVDSFPLNS